ncbi:MAG: hypothetical protein ABIZ81_06640 [Opitutaceae bacterium]
MKNWLITLVVGLCTCVAAFCAFYAMNSEPALHRAALEKDAMAWLRAEFHLDEAQLVAIKKQHDSYGVVCGQHCVAIIAAKGRAAPAAEIAALEKTCVEAMTGHFRQVATLMPPGEGERYLATVLPRIKDHGHEGVPNLRATP